jgi:hypothetical protein
VFNKDKFICFLCLNVSFFSKFAPHCKYVKTSMGPKSGYSVAKMYPTMVCIPCVEENLLLSEFLAVV